MRAKLKWWVYAGIFLLLRPSPALSAEDPSLEGGWQEYQFQSFKEAARRFDEIEETTPDAAARREARLGQAMTAQFRESGRDPKAAGKTYQQLEEGDASDAVGLLARSMRAELLAEAGDLDDANRIWDEVITGHPDTLIAQDALLRRTLANMCPMVSDQTLEAVHLMARRRERFPAPTREHPGLAPVMDAFAGEVYFWREEYGKAREAFIRSAELRTLKTASYHSVANTNMRIARISEVKLDDPKTAGRYYRRLLIDTPNDPRMYYAMERAADLGSVTRAEVEAMELAGFTPELLDSVFGVETP